jgi:hypothetical protein
MNNPHSRIDRLKEMLSLEEQRETLQHQLEAIVERLNEHKNALFSKSEAPATAAAPARAAAPQAAEKPVKAAKAPKAPKAAKAGRAGRGALKERVFAALHSAGHAGVYVKELAQAIGTKPVNIHAWFHAAVKKHPQIKKLTGGHYRLEGALPGATESAASAPAAKAPKAPKAPKASKVKAGAARNGAVTRSPRGELSSGILAALEAAGAKGASVSELADKVGVQYKNVSIWFATTGKKNGKVKRIGRGQYRLTK